jgi:dTDP-4-amino-4,6-dideoxygalactose transaminase
MKASSGSEIRERIYLSPPHLGTDELRLVQEAFATNWIAPLGPQVDAFERELADYVGVPYAAALSSGTAALHLALRILDLKPGDEVICSTLTFSASANPILYEGGRPVFVDCDRASWNMDPDLLRQTLKDFTARGRTPRAAIVVDLYGQSADYDPIQDACAEYNVPVIEDAAEALGATYRGRKAGVFGKCAVFSFNGNKIITTSGGGMLVSHDQSLIERARFLATQARDPAPHYQHSQVGYNYRLSNVLAAIGRGQLRALPERIAARKRNRQFYESRLNQLPGIQFMPQASYGQPNYWLTCITIDSAKFGADREEVRIALEKQNIEARPIWKPLHLQPIFADFRAVGGHVAEEIFQNGLCLPSGSSLSVDDLERVTAIVTSVRRD